MNNKPEENQQDIRSYKGILDTLMDGEAMSEQERYRVRQVYDLAVSFGLETNTIQVGGESYSALQYAVVMNCLASKIAEKIAPEQSVNKRLGSLLIVSLLVATAESMKTNWSYGAELLYHRGIRKIPMDRPEILAFMAQEGDYASCREKSQRLNGNWLAVAIYCGKNLALYNSLPDTGKVFRQEQNEPIFPYRKEETKNRTQQQAVEYLMTRYAPLCMADSSMEGGIAQVQYFLQYLASSDFYFAPASTKHHANHVHGLVWHSLNVTEKLIEITEARTERQIALCVMAGVCHDLCKESFYKPYTKNEKVYSPNGQKSDELGTFDWQSKLAFTADPEFPIGHGGKSVHIAVSFFGGNLPACVASAIDAHMMDNPNFAQQVAEHPLGLWLHLADAIATYIDEVEPIKELREELQEVK